MQYCYSPNTKIISKSGYLIDRLVQFNVCGKNLSKSRKEDVSAATIENVQSIMVDRNVESCEETFLLDESDLDHLWEEYWSEKGEQIIWASWIEKYQNYINLDYIENSSVVSDFEVVKPEDKNPLPGLMENLAIMNNNSATTDAALSDAAIIQRNETHQIDSEHSKNDTVSPPQPSANNTDAEASCSADNANEFNVDQQWQNLWNEHYGEQYNKSFSEFISKKRKINDNKLENVSGSGISDAIVDDGPEYLYCNDYSGQMNDLGLPTAFGRKKNVKEHRRNASLDDLSTSTVNSDRCDDSHELDANKSKRKRPNKKKKLQLVLNAVLPEEIANDKILIKYWSKRFSLFSLFDLGIKLDRESWFSVTPEKIAAYTASRCECDVIVDAFCGAGGNTIQFAKTCRKVIAIDIDPIKIEMAKHNASVYGVTDKIEFIVGNYIDLADALIADAVFLSPPWGGPEYLKNDVYDVEEFLIPVPASKLMAISRRISPNICIYLPRNSNKSQLSVLAGPGNSVEVNQEFLGPRLIAITAYYGDLLINKN